MIHFRSFLLGIGIFLTVSLSHPRFSFAEECEKGDDKDVEKICPSLSYWGKGGGWNILWSSPQCGTEFETIGYQPRVIESCGPNGCPLFLYLPGTMESYNGNTAEVVLKAMARRGFVAISADYEKFDWDFVSLLGGKEGLWETTQQQYLAVQSEFDRATACMFDPTRHSSLVGTLCSHEGVDCGKGIAVWGFSQGGGIAFHAAAYDRRVRAVWATGAGGGGTSDPWNLAKVLPHDRLRIVNGSQDPDNNNIESLNRITGRSCGTDEEQDIEEQDTEEQDTEEQKCQPQVTKNQNCLDESNGSGWYLVQPHELKENGKSVLTGEHEYAGHCWFSEKNDATGRCFSPFASRNLDPCWLPPDEDGIGGQPFSVDTTGVWLKEILMKGEVGTREMVIDFDGFEYQPEYLPLSFADVRYPRGVIAWDKNSNFTVCGPDTKTHPCVAYSGEECKEECASYGVVGTDGSEQTAFFSFVDPQSWELMSMTLYNSGRTRTKVTIWSFGADGSQGADGGEFESGQRKSLFFKFGQNVQTFAITIGNGTQTKIEKLVVKRAEPSKISETETICPAPRIALRASNGRYVSSNPYDPDGPLQARALQPLKWETFTCVDLKDGKVALKRGSVFVQSNGTNPQNNSLNARWTGPKEAGETEKFTFIDFGNDEFALRASNGLYVSADQLLKGTPLVADRSKASSWERFKVVRLP